MKNLIEYDSEANRYRFTDEARMVIERGRGFTIMKKLYVPGPNGQQCEKIVFRKDYGFGDPLGGNFTAGKDLSNNAISLGLLNKDFWEFGQIKAPIKNMEELRQEVAWLQNLK